ncbi:hypothetical protein MXB_1725 [Myxobolus squamalis]|nr:hypothetical protein MXB_1725 [Myxobolus squamalis]
MEMIVAITFVSPNSINTAIAAILVSLLEALLAIYYWFEDTYVGRCNLDGTRRAVLFLFHVWSEYTRTINGLNQNKTYAETAHHKLQAEFGMDHPYLWKFINGQTKIKRGTTEFTKRLFKGTGLQLKG